MTAPITTSATPREQARHTDTRRMHLRGLIMVAGEIVATYWPMRTFVHHNPLHGLEDLPFDDAVRRARRLLGGEGYLPNRAYRNYLKKGRITPEELDDALGTLAQDKQASLGVRSIAHAEVLRTHLLHGITPPAEDTLETVVARHRDRDAIRALASHLATAVAVPAIRDQMAAAIATERAGLGRNQTMAAWCDRLLGAGIAERIDREMVKWCEAFLDEGHAAWPMPGRERGFFGAWRWIASQERSPCGIAGSRRKLDALPERSDDALIDSLDALGIPAEAWADFLSRHLTALPGWAGFIKWRSTEADYEWQQSHPADLLQYLAVRVWYERELAQQACREALGLQAGGDGLLGAIGADMDARPHLYYLLRERGNGHLPADYATALDRIRYSRAPAEGYRRLAEQYAAELGPRREEITRLAAAWRLHTLARALGIDPASSLQTPTEELRTLLDWLDGFPESEHGPVWLTAFEAGYRRKLIQSLVGAQHAAPLQTTSPGTMTSRHQAQAAFCIDVRSEPYRRHLEEVGDYETFGIAGFFAAFIRFRGLGLHHDTDQFPVIMKAKNSVREVIRTYHSQLVSRHETGSTLLHAGHALLHDLKENVVTPYVAVESIGWFYGLPFIGKTVFTAWYQAWAARLRHLFVPKVATTVTVDKLTRDDVNEMLAAEQRSIIRRALQAQFGDRHLNLSLERLEFLRKKALEEPMGNQQPPKGSLTVEEETAFVADLRMRYRINPADAFARMERITRIGFTHAEQVFTVETALRLVGLTGNFARLVLLCGHGSTSDNNPFEAALDCGACGGNSGKPNARVLAAMANRPLVRAELAKNGLVIPPDTYFLAGQHDTTTDRVELFDLEEIPHTHLKDLQRLMRDLEEAGRRNSRERCRRFPEIAADLPLGRAALQTMRRSGDWSEVRPEWGLSGNCAFVVGRRELTRGVDLDGRVFLHSYDYRIDAAGRLLEIIMTGPQVVGQWINMEHYFSTTDPEVYGSGSKIYHNVVGRFGVMAGPQSDLRTGLAWQTVMGGDTPFHEPMRILVVIEAPREQINQIIRRHRLLQLLYHGEWVRLVALEPEERTFYDYHPIKGWVPFQVNSGT
jgi:uncharacterized protein YbcC (UPF0753/DUF2309 family)